MEGFWAKAADLTLSVGSKGKGSGVWRYLRQELKKKRWKKTRVKSDLVK